MTVVRSVLQRDDVGSGYAFDVPGRNGLTKEMNAANPGLQSPSFAIILECNPIAIQGDWALRRLWISPSVRISGLGRGGSSVGSDVVSGAHPAPFAKHEDYVGQANRLYRKCHRPTVRAYLSLSAIGAAISKFFWMRFGRVPSSACDLEFPKYRNPESCSLPI